MLRTGENEPIILWATFEVIRGKEEKRQYNRLSNRIGSDRTGSDRIEPDPVEFRRRQRRSHTRVFVYRIGEDRVRSNRIGWDRTEAGQIESDRISPDPIE